MYRRKELGALVVFLTTVLALFAPPTLLSLSPSETGARPVASPANLLVAPDLAQRVAKFKQVNMAYSATGLSANERRMVAKLVDAAGLIDCVYWRQSDPEGLQLYLSLAKSPDPQDVLLRRYLKINGSRFDLIDENKPFVGTEPLPAGHAMYPADLTRAEFDAYVTAHPDQKTALYNAQTIVVRKSGRLTAVAYHVQYKDFILPMAQDLREAAMLAPDPAFAKFLRMRADALLDDDYFASDVQWLELDKPKFDIIFAPYETYLDDFLGVKTSYGASVMIRNDRESEKLSLFQRYVPDLQESLPLAAEDLPSKRGKQSPMEVVDGIYRAGDLLHGYQAVADNLPNDPRIHEQKGSKKIFWKNFMDARVNYIILPLAERLMRADQAALVSGEGYLDFTILHEISHGLGPAYARTKAGRTDVREAIGPQYSALEEAKADVVGQRDFTWLADHGVIAKEKQQMEYASYLAGILRSVRFGVAEAHGAAEMMEFNYLFQQSAIARAGDGLYEIDFAKMPGAVDSLAKELLVEEATGDRRRAEAWFKKYAVMPPELSASLAKANDIPVDVDPQFSFDPPLH